MTCVGVILFLMRLAYPNVYPNVINSRLDKLKFGFSYTNGIY